MNSSLLNAIKVAMAGAIVLLFLGVGCIKRDEYPIEPRIAFERLQQLGDSASLTISFTDGDGDIGLNDGDSEPPFDLDSEYYYNLFVTYEGLHNGEWHQPDLGESPLHGRIPRITPTGQNKLLKGEISLALPWPIQPGSPYDTVRFSVRLVDRALHSSNTVSTGSVVVE